MRTELNIIVMIVRIMTKILKIKIMKIIVMYINVLIMIVRMLKMIVKVIVLKIVYIGVLMRLVSITPVMLNLIDYPRLKLIELMKVIKIIKVIVNIMRMIKTIIIKMKMDNIVKMMIIK